MAKHCEVCGEYLKRVDERVRGVCVGCYRKGEVEDEEKEDLCETCKLYSGCTLRGGVTECSRYSQRESSGGCGR